MSRLPIDPGFDRFAKRRPGRRIALAVGTGTLALGLAAGALAAAAHLPVTVAYVRHVNATKPTAPSALRGGDLFTNPVIVVPAPAESAAAPVAQAAPRVAQRPQEPSDDHKKGVPPPAEDQRPAPPSDESQPPPKAQPTQPPEPQPTAEPTPSPGD